MKKFLRGSLDYLTKAKMAQKLVLGWVSSPALGLKMVSAYEEVAVEGKRAKDSLNKKKLGDIGRILSSVPEGGDPEASLSSSLSLISQLLEADVISRERWIYLILTLGMSLSVGISLAITLGRVNIRFYHLLALLLLYPIIPSLSMRIPEGDPSMADLVASYLEKGGGRIYALKGLGLYERLVVDDFLHNFQLPEWAEVMKNISDRKMLASIMRKTSNMLKEFNRITSAWKARIKSLRAMTLVISSAIGISNVLLMRVMSSPLLGFVGSAPDLPLMLLISGLVSVALSSKPVGFSLESSAIYLFSFSIAYFFIP